MEEIENKRAVPLRSCTPRSSAPRTRRTSSKTGGLTNEATKLETDTRPNGREFMLSSKRDTRHIDNAIEKKSMQRMQMQNDRTQLRATSSVSTSPPAGEMVVAFKTHIRMLLELSKFVDETEVSKVQDPNMKYRRKSQ